MAKIDHVEFVKGHSVKNGGYDWTRLDVFFKAVDGGDPVRLGVFIDGRTQRLIGLKEEECIRKQ